MIWIGFAAITLIAITALLLPVIRSGAMETDAKVYDQEVYRAQLAEVDKDEADGRLSAREADDARLEIKRRLLAADRRASQDATPAPGLRMGTVAGISVLLPFVALATYFSVGSPNLPGAPIEQRRAEALDHPDQANVDLLVEQLADRLRADPDNMEGWVLLARTYRQMNANGEAVSAYRRALSLGTEDPAVLSEFGEALTAMNGGTVPREAVDVLTAAVEGNREDPRARFYLGLARAQAGDTRDAIAIWRDLTANAPPDAAWANMVREQMGNVAMAAGIMPIQVTPRHPLDERTEQSSAAPASEPIPVPSPADMTVPDADPDDYRPDVSALAGRFSGEELEMIQNMVGGLQIRLENDPSDYDGWMQLGRSYGVLQDFANAKDAYRQATAARPEEIEPRVLLADLLLRDVGASNDLPDELIATTDTILTLDPDNPDGLFIGGLASARQGNVTEARERWTALLDVLPPNDPARQAVRQRLAELPGSE